MTRSGGKAPIRKASTVYEQSLFVPEILPGFNEMMEARAKSTYCGTRRFDRYQQMKKKAEKTVAECIMAARLKPVKRAYFIFTWIEQNRKRDPDNIAVARKFILDALVTKGILENDGWKQVAGWHDSFVVKKGRQKTGVNITIWPSNE